MALGSKVLPNGGDALIDRNCNLPSNHPSPGNYVRGVVEVLQRLPIPVMESMVERLLECYRRGGTLYSFGNGGSASLASHLACDFGKGTRVPGKKPFRVVSLTDNLPMITAWANDSSYENIFAEQLMSLIGVGDVAFAISGSGNSPNVLRGLETAREAGAVTLGLSGFDGGKMKGFCELCLIVPSHNMQYVEDCHLTVMHSLFLTVRQAIMREALTQAIGAAVYVPR